MVEKGDTFLVMEMGFFVCFLVELNTIGTTKMHFLERLLNLLEWNSTALDFLLKRDAKGEAF